MWNFSVIIANVIKTSVAAINGVVPVFDTVLIPT